MAKCRSGKEGLRGLLKLPSKQSETLSFTHSYFLTAHLLEAGLSSYVFGSLVLNAVLTHSRCSINTWWKTPVHQESRLRQLGAGHQGPDLAAGTGYISPST